MKEKSNSTFRASDRILKVSIRATKYCRFDLYDHKKAAHFDASRYLEIGLSRLQEYFFWMCDENPLLKAVAKYLYLVTQVRESTKMANARPFKAQMS